MGSLRPINIYEYKFALEMTNISFRHSTGDVLQVLRDTRGSLKIEDLNTGYYETHIYI